MKLAEAYAWWKASVSLKATISSGREILNVFERWLISRANGSHEADAKAINELMHLKGRPLAAMTARKMLQKTAELYAMPADTGKYAIDVTFEQEMVKLKYRDFVIVIDSGHFHDCRLAAIACGSDDGLEPIVTQAMYYEGYLSQGQTWSFSAADYQRYTPANTATIIEAFASPFNNQVVHMKDGRTAAYCSMLPGDRELGSFGSFFELSLDKFTAPICLLVNPPFIEEILLKAVIKCEAELTRASTHRLIIHVVFITPQWTDAAYYKLLIKSKYLHTNRILSRGTYSYEEQFTLKKIPAVFDSHVWVLNNEKISRQ